MLLTLAVGHLVTENQFTAIIYVHCVAIRYKIGEPTSGLEPLTCSLGVIHQALQRVAGACKSRISRGLSLLGVAECCTVLRSRWCQSGVKSVLVSPNAIVHL